MHGRGTVAVAAVSALVAAVVSALTTLVVIRLDRSPAPAAAARSAAPAAGRTASDLSALFSSVASGVVRIETTACTQGSVGSGFLVAPDLVATVAHVVGGAHKIVLTAGGDSVPGTVIGLDDRSELALVRADRPFAGHVFTLTDRLPAVGSEVVGLGYPLGGGLSLVHGIVSAVDRSMTVGSTEASGAATGAGSGAGTGAGSEAGTGAGSEAGTGAGVPPASATTIAHLLQLDGLFTGGDSGGPLVAADGSVVGLVEARATQAQGIGFAVAAPTARTEFAGWQARPTPVHVSGDCAAPVGPPDAVAQVSDVSGSPDGPAVQTLLGRFATLLNAGRYADAFDLFSPAAQRRTTLAQWTAQERSSRLFDLVVHQVAATPAAGTAPTSAPTVGGSSTAGPSAGAAGPRTLQAEITFTSVQDSALGADGQSCSLWHLTYTLVWSGGAWRIDRAVPQAGSPQAC